MLSIQHALEQILQQANRLPAQAVDLQKAAGLILAEDILSDVDSPPHDKAMVDGYALKASDLREGNLVFNVLETVTAGEIPQATVVSGSATQIMTGAPMPTGADCVVMVEDTNQLDENRIELTSANYRANQNIMPRATSLAKGKQVLSAGTQIRHIEAGLLAEVGVSRPSVYPKPSVAILATGNELVPADTVPQAGQIRNSNGPMLTAAVCRSGANANHVGIAHDDETSLRENIGKGLQADILLLSGGVSAGVLDLVPNTLQSLGVKEIFHKVNLKPGKPLWFGVLDHESRRTLVFGLPGNPVGGLVCFELFVKPAIRKLAGDCDLQSRIVTAKLTREHAHRGGRMTYFPARINYNSEGQLEAMPLSWHGSGDLATLSQAQGLIIFPTEGRVFQAGEVVEIHLMDSATSTAHSTF